jgi:hypothetical protein
MQFDKNTPRETATIQGQDFEIPSPFEEGHPCTANEAAALNQLLKENVRNNFANRVKKAVEDGTFDAKQMQKDLEQYVAEYEFGVRRGGSGGSTPVDPVEKEAMALARDKVKQSLKSQGYKISEVGAEKINELAAQVLEKYPKLREQAKQIVDLKKQTGEDALQLEGLDQAAE